MSDRLCNTDRLWNIDQIPVPVYDLGKRSATIILPAPTMIFKSSEALNLEEKESTNRSIEQELNEQIRNRSQWFVSRSMEDLNMNNYTVGKS